MKFRYELIPWRESKKDKLYYMYIVTLPMENHKEEDLLHKISIIFKGDIQKLTKKEESKKIKSSLLKLEIHIKKELNISSIKLIEYPDKNNKDELVDYLSSRPYRFL